MPGTGQDRNIIEVAVVLAIAAVTFRRAILRALIAILAVVALALLGAGAATLLGSMHP
jgi:hypothetical protein